MNSVRLWIAAGLTGAVMVAGADAQTRRARPRPPAPQPPPAVKIEPAVVKCPQLLGVGVRTKRQFCEVLVGREPVEGVLVTIPPHAGPATLLFDLHNRQTYSEEAVKANRA